MGLSEENVGKLEEAAAKRKERLAALKKRKRKISDENPDKEEQDLPEPQVLFRNYKPTDEIFEEAIVPQAEPSKVENLIDDQLKFSETKTQIADVEISSLAPKKVTYDLRRGIQEQLDRLERRTDKAIAELIRERLKEGKQQDFSMAVSAADAAAAPNKTEDSDED